MPLARGLGCPPKIIILNNIPKAILVAEEQGRPQGAPLPDCIASMCTVQCMVSNKRFGAVLVLWSGVDGKVAPKRTPHDESCGLFPHLYPCVPCSVCSITGTMGHWIYSAMLDFILIKILKFIYSAV